ncbi:MAG TPA: hypothetical protein DCY88_30690 [Cyanobacteria bacterium UBA11372]|nr:hypothetical protein [Cyanobacteria bacterium UBA11372]
MKKEFNLRSLRELTKRLNEEPSLIEDDWRQVFFETFEFTAAQRKVLDELEFEDNGRDHLQIQAAFSEAMGMVRKGGKIKLRVSNDLDLGRRVLRLQVRQLADEETLEPDTDLAILCCCADCKCWHRCGTSPNPCRTCT